MMTSKFAAYKMIYKKIGRHLACTWIIVWAMFSPALGQSLRESLALAYDTNPALRAERADLKALDEMTVRARAQRRPSLQAVFSLTYADGRYEPGNDMALADLTTGDDTNLNTLVESLTGNTDKTSQMVGVQAEQYLFRGLRTHHEIRESTARIAAARARLINVEQDVLLATIQAYLRVLTTRQSVNIAENSIEVLKVQLDATTTSFEVGTATRTDIAQAEARLARTQATLIRANADKKRANLEFTRLIGQNPVDLETAPPLPDLPVDLQTVLSISNRQNPLLVGARAREMASVFALKKAKGLLSPSVKATASLGYIDNNFIDGDQTQNATLGAELSVPLFHGGRNYAAIREARAANMADRHRVRDTTRQVDVLARTAWNDLMAARAERIAADTEIAASALVLDGVRLENRLGQRTIIDILNAEQDLLNARLGQLQAKERQYIASYQVQQAMGTLTAIGLALDVPPYDPTKKTPDVSNVWEGLRPPAKD